MALVLLDISTAFDFDPVNLFPPRSPDSPSLVSPRRATCVPSSPTQVFTIPHPVGRLQLLSTMASLKVPYLAVQFCLLLVEMTFLIFSSLTTFGVTFLTDVTDLLSDVQ